MKRGYPGFLICFSNGSTCCAAYAKERGWEIQDWGMSDAGNKKKAKKPMFDFMKQPARQ